MGIVYFVSLIINKGTGGTLTGVSSMLKIARPECKIIACEPAKAAMLSGNGFASHMIQGWTPDFIPEVLDRDCFDELIQVKDEDAISASQSLVIMSKIF